MPGHRLFSFEQRSSGNLNCKLRRRRAETENGLWFIVSSLRVVKSPNSGARHHLSPHLRNFYSVSLTCGMGEGKGKEGGGGGEEERETRRKDDVRWQWDGSTW